MMTVWDCEFFASEGFCEYVVRIQLEWVSVCGVINSCFMCKLLLEISVYIFFLYTCTFIHSFIYNCSFYGMK